MRQSLEAAGYDLKRLTDKADMNYGEKLKPVNDEAKAWKTVWSAGQGAGNIRRLARRRRGWSPASTGNIEDALRNMDSSGQPLAALKPPGYGALGLCGSSHLALVGAKAAD
ncbi:hypothetical protein ACPA9J_35850 [Pseudomonas aeruginosa]